MVGEIVYSFKQAVISEDNKSHEAKITEVIHAERNEKNENSRTQNTD